MIADEPQQSVIRGAFRGREVLSEIKGNIGAIYHQHGNLTGEALKLSHFRHFKFMFGNLIDYYDI